LFKFKKGFSLERNDKEMAIKTHDNFVKELNNKNNKIKVLGLYTEAKNTIKVQCLKCTGIWEPIAGSLLRGNGCPYCCNAPRKILIGLNDMWTTNPKLAELLLNSEDGYKYTQHSSKIVNWRCPDCGNVINNKRINSISKNGLSCNLCGDKIPYCIKFLASLLNQLKIDFESEKTFDWLINRRYDFYIPILNMIIEVHGMQHYSIGFERISKKARNLEEEQINDELKKETALHNKINNYIIIDGRYSDLYFIRNIILNSELITMFDLSNIDWLKCHEYACKSLVKVASDYWHNGINNVKEIARLMKLSKPTIISYLKKAKSLNWCDYDPKNEIRKTTIKNNMLKNKMVMCIETAQIYESLSEAARNVIRGSNSHISSCCKGKRKTCGILEDGTLLHWKYV
jgi:ribosomal protein S27E